MRILIVGNSPHEIGGVANYTRPLAKALVEQGNEIFYLYSGAFQRSYDWRLKPYLKINNSDFEYECAELINAPCWSTNYKNPDIDIVERNSELLVEEYLDRIKPDIMHIHSRLGLPASIAKCASDREIPVINTIHVYGYLCQKRVMIDYMGNTCEGPSDLAKCALCTDEHINISKLKFTARMAKASKRMLNIMVVAKRILKGAQAKQSEDILLNTPNNTSANPLLVEGLTKRLDYMVNLINTVSATTICVSQDVKNTLMCYGVREEKLIVQHIGSLIAETQTPRKSPMHTPLVIGNIGGVYHYKGTHVLIDAIERMKSKNFAVKIFGKYEEDYKQKLMKGREQLPIEFTGRYAPSELPELLEQIDVMVLPSICNDTAPQTIFESYSRYVPIVASNIGGFPDFVKDRINGRLFTSGDADQLARILDEIVENPQQLLQYSNQIPKLKTISQNAVELLSLYGSLVRVRACD